MGGHTQTSTRPARGAELELTVDTLAHGGNGVARLDGYVVFVAGALPGDRVRAVVGKSKRAYAEARAVEILEPSPDRIAPRGRPSRRAVAGARLRRASSRSRPSRSATRCAGSAGSRGSSRTRSCPPSSSGATATSSSTRSAPARTGRSCAASTRPAASTRSSPLDDCLLASERGNAAREQVLAWAREQGLSGLGPARPARPAAQPRRPRGPAHRRAAGAARHLARRDRHRRAWPRRSTARACSGRRPPGSARAPRAARRSGSRGSKRLREQLGELEFLISPEAFFQTNTEMAEVLYGAADRARRACAGTSASSTSTAGSARSGSRSPAARARWSASRSSSRPSPTRSTTRAATRSPTRASSPATSGWRCASSSSRPASPTSA